MGRILLAALAGAVVYYLFVFASWMAFGIHESSMRPLPDDEPVTSLLKNRKLETGVYVVPAPEVDEDATAEEITAAWERMAKRHEEGPVYSVFYTADGGPMMGPGTIVTGFLIDLLSAGIAAFICSLAAAAGYGYLGRVGVVVLLGVFAAIITHIAYWNWMWFPLDHTIAMAADVVIGWILAGLAIAAIVRPAEPKVAVVAKAA